MHRPHKTDRFIYSFFVWVCWFFKWDYAFLVFFFLGTFHVLRGLLVLQATVITSFTFQ